MPRNNHTSRNTNHDRSQAPKSRDRTRRRSGQGTGSRAGYGSGRGRERHLSVRGELRSEPDVRKIARAVIALAMAQAEADAAAGAAFETTAPADEPIEPAEPIETGPLTTPVTAEPVNDASGAAS